MCNCVAQTLEQLLIPSAIRVINQELSDVVPILPLGYAHFRFIIFLENQ